jgi:hypothetical protein
MRLIDADKLQQFPIRANRCDKEHANTHFINGIESVMEYAERIPTVDAEVVVRCRDCKYFMEYTKEYAQNADGADGDCYIRVMNSCNEQFRSCNYDDFCSYGERKEGAEC